MSRRVTIQRVEHESAGETVPNPYRAAGVVALRTEKGEQDALQWRGGCRQSPSTAGSARRES